MLIILLPLGCVNHLHPTRNQLPTSNLLIIPAYWVASGKILGKSNEGSWSATFTWEQKGQTTYIQFIPLLSTYTIKIIYTPFITEIKTPTETLRTNHPDSFMYEHFGWNLPVSDLKCWLTGIPTPNPHHKYIVDHLKRPRHFEQNNWRIEYKDYFPSAHYLLPKRLYLNQLPYQVRIIIHKWIF